MWKLIFRNLWSRKRRVAWLFAEIVVVTIVIWVFIDPIIVNGYVESLPLGYDRDRLCLIKTNKISEVSPEYDPTRVDSVAVADDMRNLLTRIRNLSDVESATIVDWSYPEAMGSSMSGFKKDSVWITIQVMPLVRGFDYLTTFGMKAIPGSPGVDELQDMTSVRGNVVVTRTVAELMFPGKNPVGHYFGEDEDDFAPEEGDYRVVGVIEDVRAKSVTSLPLLVFNYNDFNPDITYNIVVRLKDDTGKGRFIHDFKERMSAEMRSGNYRCYDIIPYEKFSKESAYASGITNDIRLKTFLSLFFFANLLLGVAGVFYLQTRKRSEEAGVMRSFGATPRRIRLMLLGEGWVLTTAGWLIGCLIYLQYAVKEGLARSHDNTSYDVYDPSWVYDLPSHFIAVSLVVYVFMLIVVSAGISISAWRISRVNPVDALRHE